MKSLGEQENGGELLGASQLALTLRVRGRFFSVGSADTP